MISINRHKDETELQYIWRICSAKDTGALEKTWDEVADILNAELRDEDEHWTSSAYRKKYQQAKSFYEDVFSKMESQEYADELAENKRELERLKVQYRDERNAWQKQNYIDARVEQKMDYLEEQLKDIGRINFKEHDIPVINGSDEMIIMLSDWHIGQCFESFSGSYNSDIAIDRIAQLLCAVKYYASLHETKKAHIVCVGDMISGSIHHTIQVTNRENVIDQVKLAIEMISAFCYQCTNIFENVMFYSVSGNHTRLTKKDEALHDDRLDDLISWGVCIGLDHIENFHNMSHRNIDTGIADLNVCGKTYIAVHGDFDASSKSGVSNLSMMLGFVPYAILRGHLHSPSFNEYNGVKVVQGGSVAGAGDQYTLEKRIFGKPSQTLLICNNYGIRAHIPVELN